MRPLGQLASSKVSTSSVAGVTLIVAALCVGVGGYGPNIELALLSAAALIVGVACLWRPGDPPVLVFVFFYQWLQASAAIIQASLNNQTLEAYYPQGGEVSEAAILSLTAIMVLAISIRVGAGPIRHDLQKFAKRLTQSGQVRTWFLLYVTSWLFGAAALLAARVVPGLLQVLAGVDALHWAFFFMLAAVHVSRGGSAGWWFPSAFLFELANSLGGYFSDFKTVFIITFLAFVTVGVRLTATRALAVGAVACACGWMAIVWTVIKPEYRNFVSGGAAAQIVTVGYPERMEKLGQLAAGVDAQKFGEGWQALLARLSYVDFFGSTIAHVPSSVPHENGALLLDAIVRPVTPRILFPDKTFIDDSVRTQLYTGRSVAGADQGASISLGWAAEMYIDFGSWGMMVAASGIGLFYGLIYRVLTTWSWSRGLLGFAAATAMLLPAMYLESSLTKVIGGLIASLLATFFVIRFIVPQWCPWIVDRKAWSQG